MRNILDELYDNDLHAISNRNELCKGVRVGTQIVLEMLKPIK